MKKADSITLMLMGIGLLPVAMLMGNVFLQSILLIGSIVLNIVGIYKYFKKNK